MKEIVNNKAKYVLVLGCQRSGTTILSACIGRHPDVSMMCESLSKDVLKGIGKDYNGNKLCLYKQIRIYQRSSVFGHIVNRIVNPFGGYKKRRPFPNSQLSISDYINLDAKIIFIVRNMSDTVDSIVRRSGISRKNAIREFNLSMSIIDVVTKYLHRGIIIKYEDFLKDKESCLRRICDYMELQFSKKMMEGQKYNFMYNEYKG